jgi:hypothetical protein
MLMMMMMIMMKTHKAVRHSQQFRHQLHSQDSIKGSNPPTNLLLFYISKHNHNHNTSSSSSSSSSSINIHSDNIQSIQSTQAPLLSIIPQHPDS